MYGQLKATAAQVYATLALVNEVRTLTTAIAFAANLDPAIIFRKDA